MSSYAREQRRGYEKWLRKTDLKRYREYKAGVAERGRQVHADNVEKVRQAESERYEAKQTQMIDRLRNDGLSDSEIDEHVSNWVDTIKPWSSDVKASRPRELHNNRVIEDLDSE